MTPLRTISRTVTAMSKRKTVFLLLAFVALAAAGAWFIFSPSMEKQEALSQQAELLESIENSVAVIEVTTAPEPAEEPAEPDIPGDGSHSACAGKDYKPLGSRSSPRIESVLWLAEGIFSLIPPVLQADRSAGRSCCCQQHPDPSYTRPRQWPGRCYGLFRSLTGSEAGCRW